MTQPTVNQSHDTLYEAAEHADLSQVLEKIKLDQPSTKNINDIIVIFSGENSEASFLIKIKTDKHNTIQDITNLNITNTIETIIKIAKESQETHSTTTNNMLNTINNNIPQQVKHKIPPKIKNNLIQLQKNHNTKPKFLNISKNYLKNLSQLNEILHNKNDTLQDNDIIFQIIPQTNENNMENQNNDLITIAGLTILTIAVSAIIYTYFKRKTPNQNTQTHLHTTPSHTNNQPRKNTQHQAIFASSYTEEINTNKLEQEIRQNGSTALNQIKQCTHVSHTDTPLNFDKDKDKGDPEFLLIVVKDPQRKTEGLAEGIFDSQTDEYIQTEGYKSAQIHLVSADFINNSALKIKRRKS